MTTNSEGLGPGDFLVADDPDQPSTWHLQVKVNGTPSHSHMGAAWAALHGGYRGNAYEGPNKAAALAKLTALYKSEGMDTPKAASEFDDPTATDVHLDGSGGAPRKRSKMLTRLIQRMRQHFNAHPAMTADQFEGHFRHALSHAGGMGRAEARNATDPLIPLSALDDIVDAILGPDDHDCEDDEMGGDADPTDMLAALQGYTEGDAHVTGADGTGFRMFLPVSCAEAPDWIPYLPKPGTFAHPRYGTITITPERNQDFVSKFNAGVYQSQVPLDAEHQTKLSGAMAWIKRLRQNGDGSADAQVEWTDRGRTMLSDNRYRYVSPEWYDTWQSPDGQTHKNVAIGGALTTRPYFKESSLRPLVANETGITVPEDDTPLAPTGATETTSPNGRKDTDMAEESQTMTEDQARTFAELQERVTAIEAERDEAKQMAERLETDAKQATERVAALELEARRSTFAEQAAPWFGDTDKHVSFMEGLSDEHRAFYVEQQDAITEQLRQSNLFSALGVAGSEGNESAAGRFDSKVKAHMAQGGGDYAAAATHIAGTEPELYSEYQAEQRSR